MPETELPLSKEYPHSQPLMLLSLTDYRIQITSHQKQQERPLALIYNDVHQVIVKRGLL